MALVAAGGLGSFLFGKAEDAKKDLKNELEANALRGQITALQESTSQINTNVQLLFEARGLKHEVWTAVEMTGVPPGVTDYLLLLFATGQAASRAKCVSKDHRRIQSFRLLLITPYRSQCAISGYLPKGSTRRRLSLNS
jgi:hypothetical protein